MNLCLRREIEVTDGGARLRDPILDRSLTLGPVLSAVARLLDGTHDAEAVISALPEHPRDSVERSLRALLWLNLIDGVDPETLEKVRALRQGESELERFLLPGSRFGCIGSGDCCQSYHFGPLSDADIALLESLPIQERFPHLGPGPYWHLRDMPRMDAQGRFLNSVDNRCVFLREDCKCGLHAEFGYDKKPGLCRYYPFEQHATIDGVQMYDKGGCSEYARTSRSGPPLAEQLVTLGPLLPPPILHHPVVLLDEETPLDYGFLHPVISANVDQVIAAKNTAPMMLRAHARRMLALLRGLERGPITAKAPLSTVAEILASPFDYREPDDETVKKGAAALASLATASCDRVTDIISRDHLAEKEQYSGRQSKELIPILTLVAEVAGHRSDRSRPLSDYAAELGAVDVGDPAIDEILRHSLSNQLFGRGALVDDRVEPALLRLALIQLVTLWGARRAARIAGRTRVEADDLSRSHMLAERVFHFRYLIDGFRGESAHAFDALEALPAIARGQ